MFRNHFFILCCCASILYPNILVAAPEPGSSFTNRPGSERPDLPEILPKKETQPFQLPAIPESDPELTLTTGPKIKLNGVKFNGNTVIDDASLMAVAESHIGKAVSLAELEQIRFAITKIYIGQGYVNSGAVLNSQQFTDGIIEFDIIEGTLDEITITGNGWLAAGYIEDRLRYGGGLFNETSSVFNVNQLRERFQLLLTDPLIEQMDGSLMPGTDIGQSKLAIDIQKARPYQLTLSYDNYRPPSIGAEQGQFSGYLRNLTGWGDIIDFTLSLTEGADQASGGFLVPLTAYDTRFNFRFDLSKSRVIEDSLDDIDINSRYTSYDFGLSQALYRNLTTTIDSGILYSYRSNRTKLLNRAFSFSEGTIKGESKVSALRLYLGFSERDDVQVFSSRVTASIGIDTFDATDIRDERFPDSDFLVWLGQLQYARRIMDNGTLIQLRGDVQYADDKLLPLERFAIGGARSVRGYRENEIVRDNGYVLSAEIKIPIDNLSPELDLIGDLDIMPFMDYGAGWNRGHSGDKTYLHSVGIGMQWRPVSQLFAEIFYAHDLNTAVSKTDYNLQDSGLHFRVALSAF